MISSCNTNAGNGSGHSIPNTSHSHARGCNSCKGADTYASTTGGESGSTQTRSHTGGSAANSGCRDAARRCHFVSADTAVGFRFIHACFYCESYLPPSVIGERSIVSQSGFLSTQSGSYGYRGSPSARWEMMFFCTSRVPPPMLSPVARMEFTPMKRPAGAHLSSGRSWP